MSQRIGSQNKFQWKPTIRDDAPIAVELCSGMGAIGTGLRALGFRVLHAYDSWEAAVSIYNRNACEPVASSCDLLEPRSLSRVRRECRRLGGIELLAAGPPCKGFSQIRNGQHHKSIARKHNSVLAAMPSYINAIRPRLVLIENVPDLLRHRKGKTFKELVGALRSPGTRGLRYRVEHGTFDAALHGTPQARRRLLILCVRENSGAESLPMPGPELGQMYSAIRHGGDISPAFSEYYDKLLDPNDVSMITSADALSDLPDLAAGEPEVARPYGTKASNAYQRLMRESAPKVLSNTQTPAVRETTVTRLERIPHGGCARDIPEHLRNGLSRRFDSAYRRLHPDAPSTALSTKYDCVYHYSKHRSLSVREYARIQGIPDSITFPETLACRRHAYEMIGNSVPPLLVFSVLGDVLNSA